MGNRGAPCLQIRRAVGNPQGGPAGNHPPGVEACVHPVLHQISLSREPSPGARYEGMKPRRVNPGLVPAPTGHFPWLGSVPDAKERDGE